MNIESLLKINVNEHTEEKRGLTYLSWAWAWAEALKADPKVTYKVEMFGDKCFMDINGTAMVWVTVTIFGKAITCQLPVMDNSNKSITAPNSFHVNTAIMRCMTKAVSLHGLGLYIYAGEDLPEGEEPQEPKKPVWSDDHEALTLKFREAAMGGMEALKAFHEQVPQTDCKMEVWTRHGQSLKAAAVAAKVPEFKL